jgi:hypothetical protein
MRKFLLFFSLLFISSIIHSQLKWIKVDSLFGTLPASVHVYKSTDSLDGKPNIAFYAVADLKNKHLDFTADTTRDRRITPLKFYERNDRPLLIVNCTFFSYETNRSLNTVIKDGKLVAYNIHTIPGRGKDTLTYRHAFASAIGISKKRKADVAWLYTDSLLKYAYAPNQILPAKKDSAIQFPFITALNYMPEPFGGNPYYPNLSRWKMKTAVGGGPVLLQDGMINITNEQELKFTGKAINDKHPRTAMGYTKDNKLIVLVIQGRFPGNAEGATLLQEARILKDLGCVEALNLDGGGSSCMLVNGADTIKPSDKEGQRPVPAVFIIKTK